MVLNFVGMLFADKIIRFIGTLQIVGWIFAIMQAALAVEAIQAYLKRLGVIKRI